MITGSLTINSWRHPMAWYTCRVNGVGPAADGTETPDGTVYINVTDTASPPGFQGGQWFYCADNSKSQMLAVAIAAISIGATVEFGAVPPNANNTPFTEVSRLYLNAPQSQ
jgi:hypothetical protein